MEHGHAGVDEQDVRELVGAPRLGPAYEKDGLLVIPVALVAGGGGAAKGRCPRTRVGTHFRRRRRATIQLMGPKVPMGSGSGGGFGGLIMPIGAYVVKGDQVRWVPAVDVTVVLLVSLSMVRLLARIWTRGSLAPARLNGCTKLLDLEGHNANEANVRS